MVTAAPTVVRPSVGGAPANQQPAFTEGSSADRSVAENTSAGVNIGDPVTATDREGDTLSYSLGGADAESFALVAATGQLLTKASLDHEVRAAYTVIVSVHDNKSSTGADSGSVDDSITVTITVADVDEEGTVTFTPQDMVVGTEVTVTLIDPDGGVSDVSWLWERSSDLAAWADIAEPTSDSYTPISNDEGNHLRATASYADTTGSEKSAMAVSELPVTAVTSRPTVTRTTPRGGGGAPANRSPKFREGSTTGRSILENTSAGVNIGDPVTATDREGDTLSYSLGGADAESFAIDAATGQLLTKASLDHEAQTAYTVIVSVHDNKSSTGANSANSDDSITVTITVTDVDEEGTVIFTPQDMVVGTEVTATLTDPDGGVSDVTWLWERSSDLAAWADIAEPTSDSYTPISDDEGSHLRATASYADANGSEKSAMAVSGLPVRALSLLEKYDANGDEQIDYDEAIAAVIAYFEGTITLDEAIGIVVLYFHATAPSTGGQTGNDEGAS